MKTLVIACLLCLLVAFPVQADGNLKVLTSFTILADFAQNVAGDKATVSSLTPPGAEVHEWELTPRNFVDIEEADIFFYNGFNTEQWLHHVREALPDSAPFVSLAENADFPTIPIQIGDYLGDPDPHLWMDPAGAQEYVRVIADQLAKLDPSNSELYQGNAQRYITELENLDTIIKERLEALPTQDRVLITSEAAFLYFAAAYDFLHDGIWGTNTEEEGTPGQMVRIIRVIQQRQPPALFWESTISDRFVRAVSEETDTPVAGPLYVDSISVDDPNVQSYVELMLHNTALLVEVLGQ